MTTKMIKIKGLGRDAAEAAVRSRYNRIAPVDFRTHSAGEMSRIDIDIKRGSSAVAISLYPERFARQERNRRASLPTLRAIRQILDGMVSKSFRTQRRTGNLHTGQHHVAVDILPETKVVGINRNRLPHQLPAQPVGLDLLQERLMGVVEAMQSTLQRTDRLIAHIDQDVVPELAPTLRDARQTIKQQPQAFLT